MADYSHGSIASSRNTLEEPYPSYKPLPSGKTKASTHKRHHGLPAFRPLVKHVTGPVTQKSQRLHKAPNPEKR